MIVLNEEALLEGLTFSRVEKLIKKACGDTYVRIGWYYQQFLKFAFAQSSYASEYYVTWDADTLPLHRIDFFENEHPLFTIKSEFHESYFDTIKRLLGIDKGIKDSYVAEHMLFRTDLVKELLAAISESSVKGGTWYEKIINACNFRKDWNAFSEFETYGTFVSHHYPGLYVNRKLNTFRKAGCIRGRKINNKILEKLSFDLDMASFETSDAPFPYNIDFMIQAWSIRLKRLRKKSVKEIIGCIRKRLR